jgi:hypothetical protein
MMEAMNGTEHLAGFPPLQRDHLSEVLMSMAFACGLDREPAEENLAVLMAGLDALANLPNAVELKAVLVGFARRCGAVDHGSVYVGTPITTGPEYLTWRRGLNGPPASLGAAEAAAAEHARLQVIAGNRERVRALVDKVRHTASVPVIDPSALADVEAWDQADYHGFWTTVIARFGKTVVFADGWTFSEGCSVEFATAVSMRLPVFDERLEPVDYDEGLRMLREATAELRAAGAPTQTQERAMAHAEQSLGLA